MASTLLPVIQTDRQTRTEPYMYNRFSLLLPIAVSASMTVGRRSRRSLLIGQLVSGAPTEKTVLAQWRSNCGCRGCPDTPKIQVGGVRHPEKVKGGYQTY